MIRILAHFIPLFTGTVLAAQPMIPQPLTDAERTSLAYTLAHYTKYEYRIPMRDGVRLFAAVYVPKDASQPYPIIMQRTPVQRRAVRRRQLQDAGRPVLGRREGGLHFRL